MIKVGLIGCGGIARAHLGGMREAGTFRVVAAVDPASDAREALAERTGATPYPSMDQMLERIDPADTPEVLVLCTPPSARLGIVTQALHRGLPVLIEKPLAHTLADAQRLADLAQQHAKVPLAVGFCHRFTPAVRVMAEWLEQGKLGQAVRLENTFVADLPHMADHWMSDPQRSGGGAVIDTGSHSLDLFTHLLGPTEVRSAVLRHAWPGRGESNASLLLTSTQTPVAGQIAVGWQEPSRFTVKLVGTEGVLEYDFDLPETLTHTDRQGQTHTLPVETHEVRFQRQLEAFAQRVRGEQTPATAWLASVEDGVAAARLVAQATDPARLEPTIAVHSPVKPARTDVAGAKRAGTASS